MINDKVQPLRKSQFILTYGPGAILESPNGPRLIPSLKNGLNSKLIKKYELFDVRMINLLKNINNKESETIKLFTLPSNASESKNENVGLYKTFIFPKWKICYENHDGYYILYDSLENEECPLCENNSKSYVRFICACPDGHLDDVNWDYAVHGDNSCKNKFYLWQVNGSSLEDILIKCPQCGLESNMEKIYKQNYFCRGRLPERQNPRNSDEMVSHINDRNYYNCELPMKIIQRQSSSLRTSNTVTLLTIPRYDSPINNYLNSNDKDIDEIKSQVEMFEEDFNNGNDYERSFQIVFQKKWPNIKREIEKMGGYIEFFQYCKKLFNNEINIDNVLQDEFNTLKQDSKDISENFIKEKSENLHFLINNKDFLFKIAKVSKIRTITVQYAYQRNPYPKKDKSKTIIESNLVDISFKEPFGGKLWYPAFEGLGEGIFITSNLNPLEYLNLNNNVKEWADNEPKYKAKYDYIKNPLFIWWHTLSHALIKSLSFISGYSSSSIRERVYIDSNTGEGGILLYNTSAGEDCGMGGLVESADNFKNILKYAFSLINNCSYDPLCHEARINENKTNGAACINCLYLSETSCEHGNMWLDRHLLLGD